MKMMKKLITTGVAIASIFTFGISSVFATQITGEHNYNPFNGVFDNMKDSELLKELADNNHGTRVTYSANFTKSIKLDEPVAIEAFFSNNNYEIDVSFYENGVLVLDYGQVGSKTSTFKNAFYSLQNHVTIDEVKITTGSNGSSINEFELFEHISTEPEPTETTKTEEVTFGLLSSGLELTTSPITTFGDIQLQSTPQTYFTSFEGFYNVKDLRGTQEGWRLDVSATPFQVVEPIDGFASGTTAHQLPVGSLTLSPIENLAAVGQSSGALPTSELSNNTIVDDGVITVAKADVGTGMGEFNLTFPTNALSLVIDASTAKIDMVNYPDGKTPYESVLTWDLVSAP